MSPAASKRKRHSAFDDFPHANPLPEENLNTAADNGTQISPPLAQVQPPTVERIERLKPSQMIPDRFQPRRLLPTGIREPFFSGEIDCYQASVRWLALSRQDSAYRGEVERLLSMGSSFEDHGQIKPITGSWVNTSDGRYLFLIETGERRFWAACLSAVSEHMEDEPLLRVEVIAQPSRQRQVLENRHAEPPSAVGQACEIASLILSEIGIGTPEELNDEFDYFRQARSQRMPAGLWEKITPVMQLTRPRMVQLLNILQFPTPLLEMADRYRLPERVLREVLALPEEKWEKMLLLSIQNQLTSDDIAGLSNSPVSNEKNQPAQSSSPTRKPPALIAASGLRRFANTLYRLDEINREQALDELADEIAVSGESESLLNLFNELSLLIQARINRR